MDINSGSTGKVSTFRTARALGAAVAETVPIPTGYGAAWLISDVDVYINPTAVAVANAADITDGTAALYLPAKTPRLFNFVPDGDGKSAQVAPASFSAISTPGGNLTMEWFR